MKTLRNLMLVIGFCVVAIAAFTIGLSISSNDRQPADTSSSKSRKFHERADVSRLTVEILQERERTAEAIRQERTELLMQLIELADQEVGRLDPGDPRSPYPWHDSKHLAILLLGEFRAAEAVSVLLENLEYKNPRTLYVSEPLEPGGWYPSAEALSKIGMPAVEPTIKKLGGYAQKNKGSELCCWVLKKMLGVKLARARLQIAIEETRDPTVKKSLTAVLPYFKTEQEKAEEERARRKKATG